MPEDTCKRELTIEVPAETVRTALESVARNYQKQVRLPGFRPGKAPLNLVRQRFAGEIKKDVLQQLVPEHFQDRVREAKLDPVAVPQIEDVHMHDDEPLRFKAVFEVLPEFELQDYQNIEVEYDAPEVTESELDKAIARKQDQAATFAPVEGRPLADGDFAEVSMEGHPLAGRGGPVKVDDVLCEIAGADTLPEFTENLRGKNAGDAVNFEVRYPDDFHDNRLAGRSFRYDVKVLGIRQKQIPELNDELAKDLGEFETLEQVRTHLRNELLNLKTRRAEGESRGKLLDDLVKGYDFPVPESMVERQIESRLERTLRGLQSQGVDITQLQTDWREWREKQRDAARRDVRAGLLLERIAESERVEVTDDEIDAEAQRMAEATRQPLEVIRARLTREGATDKLKHRLRVEKTHEILFRKARRVPPRKD